MIVIEARNVQTALWKALQQLDETGVIRESRNGPVKMFPVPITTVYKNPLERVMFWPERDANPFFHLMESLWMLSGRNDVEYVASMVERMKEFSDDGVTFNGAYGHRWRQHFGQDQLNMIIEGLKKNPDDRRQVLGIWDPSKDLNNPSKDVPCNIEAVFQITHEGKLDMNVFNRSNDMVWGAYGANAVHFSYLQEYIASCVGVPVGVYRQISCNLHVYSDVFGINVLEKVSSIKNKILNDPYSVPGVVKYFPLMSSHKQAWDNDLSEFMANGSKSICSDRFFTQIAIPMRKSYDAFKNNKEPVKYERAMEALTKMANCDWKLACEQWVQRRWNNYLKKGRK